MGGLPARPSTRRPRLFYLSAVRPYIGMGLGITRLLPKPADFQDETRFAASLAGGIKVWLGRHLGLRLEARGLFTVLESETDVFCAML